jgi:hypothetical protein
MCEARGCSVLFAVEGQYDANPWIFLTVHRLELITSKKFFIFT